MASILALGACLSLATPGDRYFEQGAYGEAAQEYARQLAGDKPVRHRDRVLYRLAFAHAIRHSPVYDLQRARDLFAQLRGEFPESVFSLRAETLVGWVERGRRLQFLVDEERQRIEELEVQISRLRGYLDLANSSAAETQGLTTTLYRQLEARDEELRTLIQRLNASTRQVRALSTELEGIKRLDLAGPP